MKRTAVVLIPVLVAMGCGRGSDKAPAITTDPASVQRAQHAADEMEMAMMGLQGWELPTDGGPVVLYGNGDCIPGSKHGPCADENCGHKLCSQAREMAAAKCAICQTPLGFDRSVSGIDKRPGNPPHHGGPFQQPDFVLYHNECWPADGLKCERCGYEFDDYHAAVSGDKIVHKNEECDLALEIRK